MSYLPFQPLNAYTPVLMIALSPWVMQCVSIDVVTFLIALLRAYLLLSFTMDTYLICTIKGVSISDVTFLIAP